MTTSGHHQIGDVATETGLSIKTIRHYDDVGLVVPTARTAGGFRLYTRTDIDRLLAIRRMKPLGFSLDDMRSLLDAQDTLDTTGTTNSEKKAATTTLAEFHERAEHACTTLARQLDYAHELTDHLAEYLSHGTTTPAH